MAQAIVPLAVAGTALSAVGQIQAGNAADKAASYQANILERNAKNRFASAQREAMEVDRQGKLKESRALAVAAASGGGASDPGVMNLIADLAGETSYRRMVSLYEGESEAQAMREQASLTRWQGKQAKKAGRLGAITTALQGGSSLYAKYGFGGPKGTT